MRILLTVQYDVSTCEKEVDVDDEFILGLTRKQAAKYLQEIANRFAEEQNTLRVRGIYKIMRRRKKTTKRIVSRFIREATIVRDTEDVPEEGDDRKAPEEGA